MFVIGVFGGLLVICTCLPNSPLKKRYGIVCHNSWRIQELGGGGGGGEGDARHYKVTGRTQWRYAPDSHLFTFAGNYKSLLSACDSTMRVHSYPIPNLSTLSLSSFFGLRGRIQINDVIFSKIGKDNVIVTFHYYPPSPPPHNVIDIEGCESPDAIIFVRTSENDTSLPSPPPPPQCQNDVIFSIIVWRRF